MLSYFKDMRALIVSYHRVFPFRETYGGDKSRITILHHSELVQTHGWRSWYGVMQTNLYMRQGEEGLNEVLYFLWLLHSRI